MKMRTAVILGLSAFGLGYACGTLATGRKLVAKVDGERLQAYKYRHYMQMLDAWMMAKKYGKPLDEYLLERGIRRVVIYGMTAFGIRLYHELKDTEIEVLYALDRNPKHKYPGLRVYRWGDKNDAPTKEDKNSPDAVIVAAFMFYNTIAPELEQAGYRNVLSLDTVLYDLMEDKS